MTQLAPVLLRSDVKPSSHGRGTHLQPLRELALIDNQLNLSYAILRRN